MTMNNEEFVLQDREGSRMHRTVRFGILSATVLLGSMVFGAQSCCVADTRAELERSRQEAELERRRLVHYTECLESFSRQECDRAYHPERRDPLTPEQRDALEAARGEQARKLYVHCTENAAVNDDACDSEVAKLMKSYRVEQ